MKHIFRTMLVAGFAALMLAGTAPTQAASTKARSAASAGSSSPAGRASVARDPYLGAMVIDVVSGRTLFEDHADAKGYPASMLKLMDLLLILERVERGQLGFQDTATVSAKASRTGGSQVWLADREVFTIDELLYALMVQSANDAAVTLAERVAGSTEAFVELMNRRARELGMTDTVFHSVHGLPPGPGQQHDVTTARDFSRLCRELLKHRDVLRYTSTRQHVFRPNAGKRTVAMRNHNRLLGRLDGCDGLKTGFIRASGYSIAATAARNGRRVVAVVLDSSNRETRDARAAELIEKGFAVLAATPPSAAPAAQGRRSMATQASR